MREKYHDTIHTDSGHIIHDSKMAFRHYKRYIPYVLVFLIVWFIYKFMVKSLGTPNYPCHFVTEKVQNYSWTFPDCPPSLRVGTGIQPVWTEECKHTELSETKYGKPEPAKHDPEDGQGAGKIKVPGLPDACMSFPVEAFPKDEEKSKEGKEGHHRTTEHEKFNPRFVKLAPNGWLYGVFAVLDTRVGPFPEIRVFGVSRVVPGDIYCQISCQEHAHAVISAPAKITPLRVDESIDDSCFWQQYVFTCKLREKCTPGYVSLSKEHCGQVAGIIPVKKVENTQTKHTFGVCLSTLYNRRDSDIAYLVEFIETNRMFGVEKVFLYGTYNVSKRYDAVVSVYRSQRFLETFPWKIPSEVNVLYKFAQLLQYSHCMYHNMEDVRYLAMVELEDLLFPVHTAKWNTLFAHLSEFQSLKDVSHMTLEKQSLCLPDLGVEKHPNTITEGQRYVQLKLVSQHAIGDFHRKPTYIIQPQGVIVPHVYSGIIAMRGWKSTKINSAMAMVYHYASNDTMCSKVTPRTRNDAVMCKHLPDISVKVLYAMEMLDLIHHGNKHHPLKPQDLICD